MKIRRIQYNIDYTHILTFKDEYKNAILPYFGFDNFRYSIFNENTINESIRMIFDNDKIALTVSKEAINFMFEGDVNDLKNQTGIIKNFWDIYEKILNFKGYKRTNRHGLIIHAVDIKEKGEVENILKNNPYFKLNPFGKIDEFTCLYDFKQDEKSYKFYFGNFSEKDIKNHDLRPFKTEFNKDLIDGVGLMCRVEALEACKETSFNKFRSLLTSIEKIISSYKFE